VATSKKQTNKSKASGGRQSAAEQSRPKKKPAGNSSAHEPIQPATSSKSRKRESNAARRARRGVSDPPKCKARRRDGTPCGAYAVKGTTVCRMHGGAAPQVREKANRRLFEMVMPAMRELRRIVESKTATDADKLRAVSMVLNRTGYSEKQSIDIGLRPASEWDRLFAADAVFSFDRDEIDAAPDRPALGGGDEDDPDRNELAKLARDELDRESYLRGLDDADIVRGEVVDEHPTPRPQRRAGTARGRTTSVGPVDFPDPGDPCNVGATEFDPEPVGRYSRSRSQRDRYEDGEEG
jgi:hypothetical protein